MQAQLEMLREPCSNLGKLIDSDSFDFVERESMRSRVPGGQVGLCRLPLFSRQPGRLDVQRGTTRKW